jgi:hypothetical protein
LTRTTARAVDQLAAEGRIGERQADRVEIADNGMVQALGEDPMDTPE